MIFNRPRRVMGWALRRFGIGEWLVHLIQSMYEDPKCKLFVGCNLSEVFSVKVGVHQGSWSTVHHSSGSPPQRVSWGCHWENLYIDGLVIISESLGWPQEYVIQWKTNIKGNVPRVKHGQNQGHNVWAGTRCPSVIWQRPLRRASERRWHRLYFLRRLFQLGSQEVQWYIRLCEARSQLQV